MGSGGGMAWCGLLLVAWCCAAEDVAVASCRGVKPVFQAKNVSLDIPDEPVSGANLTVCEAPASCCTPAMEAGLRLLVKKDFQALLHHNSRSLEGLLASTAANLQERMLEATRRSRNRTLALFDDVYPRLAATARRAATPLYADVLAYLDASSSSSSSSLPSSADLDLERSAADFFASLFPEVYRRALAPGRGAFAADYEACLRAAYPALLPFGDVPRAAARGLRRSAEAARTLLQALALGAEVLASTDSLLMSEPGAELCHAALLRMSYCSRCRGLTRRAKPCAGYCLNVMRGCLTQHAAELDLPWSGFVEATERLVVAVRAPGLDVQQVVAALPGTISDGIMLAMEEGPALQRKVKQRCGPARWGSEESEEAEEVAAPGSAPGAAPDSGARDAGASLAGRLHIFVASLAKSRGFYANLAESLCSDESFAETRDTADCWNGQRIGEYTKTVVAASLSAQKYNPELAWTQRSPDARIAQLSDKLRHIRQVVLTQLTQSPESDSLLAEEGSGSGSFPAGHFDDEDQNLDWSEQGSGSGDDTTDIPVRNVAPVDQNPKLQSSDHAGTTQAGDGCRTAPRLWVVLALAIPAAGAVARLG
ncbi:glypican-5 [Bacillus rossius redtenbacheri]|uniref:glypican-5 n=1 Tax=Bacillus rossius redtenbacheri TaxID=93214 RepID=UPI002FDD4EFE